MGLKERLSGEWLWTLNMEVHREGGISCMLHVYLGEPYALMMSLDYLKKKKKSLMCACE